MKKEKFILPEKGEEPREGPDDIIEEYMHAAQKRGSNDEEKHKNIKDTFEKLKEFKKEETKK